eukprot:5992453-Amphidinium_carterae.1
MIGYHSDDPNHPVHDDQNQNPQWLRNIQACADRRRKTNSPQTIYRNVYDNVIHVKYSWYRWVVEMPCRKSEISRFESVSR